MKSPETLVSVVSSPHKKNVNNEVSGKFAIFKASDKCDDFTVDFAMIVQDKYAPNSYEGPVYVPFLVYASNS